jgi:pimeloyl-ACP methyl ester carboxylesterase
LNFAHPGNSAALLPAWPALQRAPAGDGHEVIVFPGLSASDASTIPLRRYIGSLGYQTQGWSQGFNFGPRAGVLEAAKRQVQEACDASGRKVSLLGWSLGGVYARELAKEMPDCVRGVITLGTPFAGPPRSTNAWRIYELTSGRNIERETDSTTCPKRRRCPPPASGHAATASWPGKAASSSRRTTTRTPKTSKWWPATSASA